MVIKRRNLLRVSAGMFACLMGQRGMALARPVVKYVSAAQKPGGGFLAIGLDHHGEEVWSHPLPDRGHDSAVQHNGDHITFFERRPGEQALVLDSNTGKAVATITCPKNRRFAGHGFYSADGTLLYAVEHDFEEERGVLGIYDVTRAYERVGELESGGIGPHEAILLSGGSIAAIANGGIATHPDFPREKLNLSTMRSNITLINVRNGELLNRFELSDRYQKLSIRHLAETRQGEIWFGAQYEGDPMCQVPLAGSLKKNGTLVLFEDDLAAFTQYKHYVGSVAASMDGRYIALTSPRGGVATIWDAETRTVLAEIRSPDICGVLPSHKGTFLFTNGQGEILGEGGQAVAGHTVSWDNHARRI